MTPFPIVKDEALLQSYLDRHPEFQLAAVCSCKKEMPAASAGGHVSASNRKWTIKAKTRKGKRFEQPHEIVGYTLMEATA